LLNELNAVCRNDLPVRFNVPRVSSIENGARTDTQDRRQLPTAEDLVTQTTAAEISSTFAKRQVVNPVEVEDVRRVVIRALVFELRLIDVEQRIEVRLSNTAGIRQRFLERELACSCTSSRLRKYGSCC